MSKVWLIAEKHFKKEVLSRGFLIALFSLPLFVALSVGMGLLFSSLDRTETTLGFVDQAGLLAQQAPPPASDEIWLVAYETEEAARRALDAGQLDAYYVLPANYRASGAAQLVYYSEPPYAAQRYFADLVRLNLLAGQPAALIERVMHGPEVTVEATHSGRIYPASGPSLGQFIPLITAALFAFMVVIAAGSMMTAVVEEKENRTMEVIVSSVSPGQMMAGKILSIAAMALLLLLVWTVVLLAALWVGGRVLEIGWLQSVDVIWRDVWLLALAAVPTLVLLAALATTLGATLVDSQEAHQVGPLLFMGFFIPFYLILLIARAPDSLPVLVLSLAPVTNLSTLALRGLFFDVPAWQYLASAAISSVLAVALIWLAGKALRLSMLRYGQRLRLREIFHSQAS